MTVTVRFWHLALIVAGVAVGLWATLPAPAPPPPDFTGQAFTSVRVELRGVIEAIPAIIASSDEQAVADELADVLRSGRPVVVCRCGAIGHIDLFRADGTSERLLLMPAHNESAIEFRYGKGRYRVNRERFLRAIRTLSVPADRWYKLPDVEP